MLSTIICSLNSNLTEQNKKLTKVLTTTSTLKRQVDIKGYTSLDNQYICPEDGYICLETSSNVGKVYLFNKQCVINGGDATQGSPFHTMLFVKKGTPVYVDGLSAIFSAYFVSFEHA